MLLYAVNGLLFAFLAYKATQKNLAAFLAALLLFYSSKAVLTLHVWAWSEPLFLFLTFLSGSVALWTFLAAMRAEPGRGILLYGGLAGLASVAGNMFTLQALGRLPEPVVFPVSLAGPVIGAVLLGILFFREKTRPLGYLGILLGLAGIVLLALS
ncbi:MAG: EamA family transporter [Candidatus Aminicenantes bacterium]|nr:EamA family transporter [Candidatus Aminicenantes bacterium]